MYARRIALILIAFMLVFAGCNSDDATKDNNASDGDQVDADGDNTTEDGDNELVVDGDKSQEDGDTEASDPDGDSDADIPMPIVSYPVVETGQTHCYDLEYAIDCSQEDQDFAGQDAQHLGRKMSFQDKGDDTVSDLVTGLMWQQTPTTESFAWEDALAYCESLSLADHEDWRAPSLKEMFSISDFGTGWPYIDREYFDLAADGNGVSKDEQYWTSNFYEVGTTHGGQDTAFGINHGTGHIKGYPSAAGGPIGGNYVRCVRGEEYGLNQFVDNGDGTVTDEATGFVWTRNDSSEGLDWQHALAYCEDLLLADKDDWRLPDVKELQSIVDYSGFFPAIDPMFQVTGITNEGDNADYPYFWSSTSAYFNPSDPGYYYAWYVAFGYSVGPDGEDTHGAGAVRFDTKAEGGPEGEGGGRFYNYVRCVRGGGVVIDYNPTIEEDTPVDGDASPVDGDVPPADGDQPMEPISCDEVQQSMPCCGDDICDGPETAQNCAVDCAAADGDAPPADGDEPVGGPVACTDDSDCQEAGACPDDAALGCTCTTMPDGDFCIPSCATDDDCPTLVGQTLVCGQEGVCTLQGGPGK